MLERWIAPLLTSFLGDYVKAESFSPDRVHLEVLSGAARLFV